MIDTVRYEQEFHLKPARWGMITIDKESNLRVNCKGDKITAVEVSLPKLLFGNNGKLIHTQEQIDTALAKADKLIQAWATPVNSKRLFKRVDLVWHFRSTPPENFFLAHRFCNHPEVQTTMSFFRDLYRITGVKWEGEKMHIKMYDKTMWKLPLPLQIVRVEILLRGKRLRQKLANGKPITALDLNACYKCYRTTLLKLHPKAVPAIHAKDEALAYSEKRGIRVFDLLTRQMNRKTITRLRKKFAVWFLKEYKIDWNTLLPVNSLPQKWDAGRLPRSKIKFAKKRRVRLFFPKLRNRS